MKKSSILLVLATITSLSFAQDIIITKDKRQIQAKIMEVSNQEIKYKKFNYQEGPLFTIPVIYSTILFSRSVPDETI